MNGPRDAIIADITQPAVAASPVSAGGSPAKGQWQGSVAQGGHPYQGRPESIRVLKERVSPPRALIALEFEDTEGRHWLFVYGATQDADGTWRPSGGAGGGGGERTELEMRKRAPWANFGGWGWPRFLCLGGRVYGGDVHAVRFIDAGGRRIEDTVENGIALLLSNEPVGLPGRVELLDITGKILGDQPWPPKGIPSAGGQA